MRTNLALTIRLLKNTRYLVAVTSPTLFLSSQTDRLYIKKFSCKRFLLAQDPNNNKTDFFSLFFLKKRFVMGFDTRLLKYKTFDAIKGNLENFKYIHKYEADPKAFQVPASITKYKPGSKLGYWKLLQATAYSSYWSHTYRKIKALSLVRLRAQCKESSILKLKNTKSANFNLTENFLEIFNAKLSNLECRGASFDYMVFFFNSNHLAIKQNFLTLNKYSLDVVLNYSSFSFFNLLDVERLITDDARVRVSYMYNAHQEYVTLTQKTLSLFLKRETLALWLDCDYEYAYMVYGVLSKLCIVSEGGLACI